MTTRLRQWILGMSAGQRLMAAFVVGVLATLVQPHGWSAALRALVTWDMAAPTYLACAWALISCSDAAATRDHARAQDLAAFAIFILVLAAAFASIAAIVMLLGDVNTMASEAKRVRVGLSALALFSSWLLIHTVYVFHYAHNFYASPDDPHQERRGLEFPGKDDPDYFDFAYYSFVVGMTSQVSDVSICARHMRRITLIHSVLSFVFNVSILALSVNTLGSII